MTTLIEFPELPLATTRLRRLAVWVSTALVLITETLRLYAYKLSAWVYWLGAAEEKAQYEARRAEVYERIAKAIVEAAMPDPGVQAPAKEWKS